MPLRPTHGVAPPHPTAGFGCGHSVPSQARLGLRDAPLIYSGLSARLTGWRFFARGHRIWVSSNLSPAREIRILRPGALFVRSSQRIRNGLSSIRAPHIKRQLELLAYFKLVWITEKRVQAENFRRGLRIKSADVLKT